jgi:hypothetical protein
MDAEHVSEAFEPQGGHIHAHESPFQPAKHHVAVEKNAADRLLEPSSNDVPGGPIQPAKGWPRSLLSAFHPDIWLYEMLSLLIAMAAFACVGGNMRINRALSGLQESPLTRSFRGSQPFSGRVF